MEQQSASAALLVRPAAFGFNAEAARSNVFAHPDADSASHAQALREFDALAKALSDASVQVLVLEDLPDPPKPDAVFPNNWLSFHADGTMVLYPMATAPRRLERRTDAVRDLVETNGFEVARLLDLSGNEDSGHFLEGTGSLVLDRSNRRAYANASARTDPATAAEFGRQLGYSTLLFDARDPAGRAIYHTNVLMSLGTRFALLCIDAIAPDDQTRVLASIEASGRTIIETSFAQLRRFGCNVLELRGADDCPVIALSEKARSNFRPDQLRALESFGELVAVDIPTIEAVGGGSVRCMIAEIHLPRR